MMEDQYYFILRIIIKLLQPKHCGIGIKTEKRAEINSHKGSQMTFRKKITSEIQ